MAAKLHELSQPPDVIEKGGHEVLRCFVVEGALSIAMRRSFDDPGMWGFLFASLARRAAALYAQETHISVEDALVLMHARFEEAWYHADGAVAPNHE